MKIKTLLSVIFSILFATVGVAQNIPLNPGDAIQFRNSPTTTDGTEIIRLGGNSLRIRYLGNPLRFEALDDRPIQIRNAAQIINVELDPNGGKSFIMGKVGLGFSNPQVLLDMNLADDDPKAIRFRRTAHDTYEFRLANSKGLAVFNQTDSRYEMVFGGDGTVGIGTTSPATLLHLHQQSDPKGLRFERNGHKRYELRLANSKGLHIVNVDNGTDEMVFDGNGNIGIGTTSPSYPLHVATSTTTRSGYFTNSSVTTSSGISAIVAETNNGGTGAEYCGSFFATGPGGSNYGIFSRADGGSTANVGLRSYVDGSSNSASFNYGLNVSMIPSTSSHNYGVYVDIDDSDVNNPPSNHFSGYFKNGKVYVGDRLGIGTTTPAASAILDIQSTDKGMLVPRLTETQRDAIADPATGLLVYVSDTDIENFFFFNGEIWTEFISGSNDDADADASNELITSVALNGNSLEITEAGVTTSVDLSSLADDADADPANELITNVALEGNNLEITEGGITTAVDLSSLATVETDPQVGNNTTNFLPKWDGSTLIQSTSVFEDDSGNVGIGTTSIPSAYKLAVDGKIISEEMKVRNSNNWPDYVFEKDYPLLPLNELEQSIQQNGHLPGIPSAAEVNANQGVEVGDMQRRLLEKVEELTLYILQLEKRIKELEEKK